MTTTQVYPKKKIHYAWLIFIGCCCLGAGGFALIFSIVGIYLMPVSQSLGIGEETLALWLAVESLLELIMMPIAGRLFMKKRVGLIMTVAALITIAGVASFSACTEFWQVLVCGGMIGLGMPFLFGIPQATLIGNWFGSKYQGRMLGIAMSCMGLASIVWAPVFTFILQTLGLSATYIVNAICMAVLILPWTIFVFKRAPQDMGLLPYGAGSGAEDGAEPEESDYAIGIRPTKAIRTGVFWLILVAACGMTFGMGFINNLPIIADEALLESGLDMDTIAMVGATMISVAAVGQLVGDSLFGFIVDKLGIKTAFISFLLLFAGAFVVWLVFGNTIGLYIGAFLLGSQDGISTVGVPLLVRRVFGGKYFPGVYSIVNMVVAFTGGLTTSAILLLHSNVGSYDAVFGVALAIIVILGIGILISISRIGKMKWEKDADSGDDSGYSPELTSSSAS